ncbi:MAG: hypothetical protein R3229_07285 [Alphaproteobacteria bacterium]|nr:hypothetical protein [Alphaproteobacteria bacterium]
MKITTALFTSALAIGLMTGFTTFVSTTAEAMSPHEVKGKITAVKREGRRLMINGKEYSVSGSRTNVCIKGACDEDRAKLKAGMSCEGNTSARKDGMELKKISCK